MCLWILKAGTCRVKNDSKRWHWLLNDFYVSMPNLHKLCHCETLSMLCRKQREEEQIPGQPTKWWSRQKWKVSVQAKIIMKNVCSYTETVTIYRSTYGDTFLLTRNAHTDRKDKLRKSLNIALLCNSNY